MNGTVTGDVIVIPHGGKAPGPMTGDDGFQRERPVAARGAAVNDNQVNLPVVLVLRTGQNSITHKQSHTCLQTEGGCNGSKYGDNYF